MTEKEQLREELIYILSQQRQNALTAADVAHDAATHEQSVAETQYDTIGLEAAYLAHGQSQRVADIDATINQIKSFVFKDFVLEDEIALGALVRLDKGPAYWFMPVCGGFKLHKGKIIVITPQSPLGQMLDGAEVDEKLDNGRLVIDVR